MPPDTEFDFVQALRDVAGSAVQPPPTELYVGGVDRGLRIRRRNTFRRTLAVAAVLVLTAAVRITLLSSAPSTTSITVATTSSTAAATVTPTASAASTGTSAGTAVEPSAATSWMPAYMLQTFDSLVPDGSSAAMRGNDAVLAPELAPRNTWGAGLATQLTTPVGTSTLTLDVQAFVTEEHCPSPAVAPDENCATTPVDGGFLTVDLSPTTRSGVSDWRVTWNGPEGQTVTLGETTEGARQALTVRQATALVTAPAWDRLWKALPTPCPLGAMINPKATAARTAAGGGFVCATSRSVATTIGATPTSPASH